MAQPSMAHLTSLRVRSYRSLKDTQFDPNEELSVLIGKNGSGKTNVLRALELLAEAARFEGERSRERASLVAIIDSKYRCGSLRLEYRTQIGFSTDDHNRDRPNRIKEWVKIRHGRRRATWRELISHRFIPFDFEVDEYNYDDDAPFAAPLPRGRVTPAQSRALLAVYRHRFRTRYYSASQFTNPSECPTFLEIDSDGDMRPSTHSSAHSRFLFDLYEMQKANPRDYAAYLSFVTDEGMGLVDSISWKTVPIASNEYEVMSGGRIFRQHGKRLLVIPNVKVGKAKLSFNQLSEGTLKTLALLFYLLTSRERLLLVEEPEVGIHHGLLAKVIEVIKIVASQKQVICSTHSDFILDALDPDQVFIVSNQRSGGTIIDRVPESMTVKEYQALKSYLQAEGNLGEYWRHGGLGI